MLASAINATNELANVNENKQISGNKLNMLTNGNLIKERNKPWTELKVVISKNTNGYLLGLSVKLILLTVNERI